MAGAREEKEVREVTGYEARDFLLFCGIYHRGGTQSVFAEPMNAWVGIRTKFGGRVGQGGGSPNSLIIRESKRLPEEQECGRHLATAHSSFQPDHLSYSLAEVPVLW